MASENKLKRYTNILAIISFGLLIRVIISLWSVQYRENTDVLRYKDWVRISLIHGITQSYETTYLSFGTLANNQPPVLLYILYGTYLMHLQIVKLLLHFIPPTTDFFSVIDGPMLTLMMRIPSLIADCLTALMIYMIFLIYKKQAEGVSAAGLYMFNPVVIYNSAVWGQVDSVIMMFFVMSILLLLRRRYYASIIALTVGLLTKFTLIIMVPAYIIIWVKQSQRKRLFIGAILSILLTVGALCLPISGYPYNWFLQFIRQNAIGEMTEITSFAMNIWWMIFSPHVTIGNPAHPFSFSEVRLINSPDSQTVLFGLPLYTWGILLFILLIFPIVLFAIKKKLLRFIDITEILSLTALIGFFVLPRMHERYMYPAITLLVLTVAMRRQLLFAYLLLTMFHLINVYIVWHPVPLRFFPYSIWTSGYFQWFISIAIGILIIYVYQNIVRRLYAQI